MYLTIPRYTELIFESTTTRILCSLSLGSIDSFTCINWRFNSCGSEISSPQVAVAASFARVIDQSARRLYHYIVTWLRAALRTNLVQARVKLRRIHCSIESEVKCNKFTENSVTNYANVHLILKLSRFDKRSSFTKPFKARKRQKRNIAFDNPIL